MKICLVLEIKNTAGFIKMCFYLKRGCIKMHKHAEMLHANKGCILAVVFFRPNLLFSKWKFRVQWPNIIGTKTWPCTPLLFLWKWITSTLSFILFEKNGKVFNPWGPVFPMSPFFLGSWVPVQVQFLDDAQNDEQFQMH